MSHFCPSHIKNYNKKPIWRYIITVICQVKTDCRRAFPFFGSPFDFEQYYFLHCLRQRATRRIKPLRTPLLPPLPTDRTLSGTRPWQRAYKPPSGFWCRLRRRHLCTGSGWAYHARKCPISPQKPRYKPSKRYFPIRLLTSAKKPLIVFFNLSRLFL